MKNRLLLMLSAFCQGIAIGILCICIGVRRFNNPGNDTRTLHVLMAAAGIMVVSVAVGMWYKSRTALRQEFDEDITNARAGNHRKRYPFLLRYAALSAGILVSFGVLMLMGMGK